MQLGRVSGAEKWAMLFAIFFRRDIRRTEGHSWHIGNIYDPEHYAVYSPRQWQSVFRDSIKN